MADIYFSDEVDCEFTYRYTWGDPYGNEHHEDITVAMPADGPHEDYAAEVFAERHPVDVVLGRKLVKVEELSHADYERRASCDTCGFLNENPPTHWSDTPLGFCNHTYRPTQFIPCSTEFKCNLYKEAC